MVRGYREPMSPAWDLIFRGLYRFLTLAGPIIRAWAGRFGLGNTVVLTVTGRRTGRPRSVALGLIRVQGAWYLGHPNGDASWTLNLRAAGGGSLRWPGQSPVRIVARELPAGDERRRAIAATWHQHPFPGNVIYWLARRHILAVGQYFRVQIGPGDDAA